MKNPSPDHYATLGLHRRCTPAQIRAAYRTLAKEHHPDVNGGARAAADRTQQLNAAHEVLSDPARRAAYDEQLASESTSTTKTPARSQRPVSKDVLLRLEDFFCGARLDVRLDDPGNPDGAETYELIVPPATAPGTRFRIARQGFFEGGIISVRVKAGPDFRFKVRGSDLRCDLKINFQRAQQGGVESVRGVGSNFLRVTIPKKIARGEILTVAGEGLPRPRGGRGDLLVKIIYSPAVQIRRR